MIGNRIKSLREKLGITQTELASHIGVSASTIGMYEQNRREPDSEKLRIISDFFNVTIDYLVLGYEPELSEADQLAEQLHKRPELKMLELS